MPAHACTACVDEFLGDKAKRMGCVCGCLSCRLKQAAKEKRQRLEDRKAAAANDDSFKETTDEVSNSLQREGC
jgi:predicted  nucleic acid-binding Zn-ribbon protein